jgi:hypothetical protein
MSIFFDAPVEPDALTTFVREVPFNSDLALSRLFPTVTSDDNTVDFAEIVRTNRTARYRSFDGRIHVSERDTGSEKRVRLAPLSSSLNMGEYERLQLEFARSGGTNRQRLAQAVYSDGEILTRQVHARLEQAWGDVITDGKLTISENGFAAEADFGVPANHIVAPATLWTDLDNATPLTDLVAWSDTWEVTNGQRPGSMQTSRRIVRLMQRNKEIIDAVHGATQGRTRVTTAELNTLLESEGLPSLRPTYETSVDVDGVSTKVVADDKLAMFPENIAELGYTAMGVTATALELVDSNRSDLSFEDAPGIVGVVIKGGPPFRQFTYVDAVGMPILANAKRLLIADVA